MSWWSDFVKLANPLDEAQQAESQVGGGVANALGLGPVAHVMEGIFTTLTDYKMWRSLGWIILGIILMLLGAAWWIGPSAARAAPTAAVARGLT